MPKRAMRVRGQAVDAVAAERDLAAHRLQELTHARDRLERRRLPGAVRADERDDLAGVDVEVDAVERGRAAVRARARLGARASERSRRRLHRGALDAGTTTRSGSSMALLAEVGLDDFMVGGDLFGRALRDHSSEVQDRHLICEFA